MIDDRLETLGKEMESARARRRLPTPSGRRSIRERAGLSQSAIARAVGTTPAAVSRWENGTRNPSLALLEPYLQVLERLQVAEQAPR